MPKHFQKTKRRLPPVDEGALEKKPVPPIVPSKVMGDEGEEDYLRTLKNAWIKGDHFSDANVTLDSTPFPHGECKGFLENEEFLKGFLDKLDGFEFHEKATDLFQFRQSDDLRAYVDPHIVQLMEYLQGKVLTWLKTLTGLPLNGNIDLFLSDYRKNDFLLCHDDELDSRRIAFILYLSPEWKADYGGNLDLFSATEDIHPKEVVKSIVPEFNKFVFFSVGATSFHQVSEVVQDDVRRFALSGWFYGDPVPRPKIEFPKDEGYLISHQLKLNNTEGLLKKFCSESYLEPDTQKDINEQIAEESQVLIPGFLLEDVYRKICEDIVEKDITDKIFTHVGPVNVANYQEAFRGPHQPMKESQNSIDGFLQLMQSKDFLSFLEQLTELPFTSSSNLRVTSSLRKYSKGSYSLLRSGGAKQTGEMVGHNEEKESKDDDEDEEDPNLVDVLFFVGSKWDETWGGLTIYSAEDGEQLIAISPEENCLAIVVRNSSVNSYVNYINCDAKDEVYFVYTMTFALDGNL